MSSIILNIVIIILLVIIIIAVLYLVFWTINVVTTIKSEINNVISEVRTFVNGLVRQINIQQQPLSNIAYGNNIPGALPPDMPYDPVFTLFMTRCIMSAVNQQLGYPLYLPPNLVQVQRVSTHGLLLRRVKDPGDTTPGNLYILAFRGTMSSNDVAADLNVAQVPFTDLSGQIHSDVLVHDGFYNVWSGMKTELNSILGRLTPNDQIAITGHSLGSALAYFTSYAYALKNPTLQQGVFALAPPRAGNQNFFDGIQTTVPLRWSIVNQTDIIPTLPPAVTPTPAQTFFYDELDQRIILDVETTGLATNHYLDTYACGIDLMAPECPTELVWITPARIVSPLP